MIPQHNKCKMLYHAISGGFGKLQNALYDVCDDDYCLDVGEGTNAVSRRVVGGGILLRDATEDKKRYLVGKE